MIKKKKSRSKRHASATGNKSKKKKKKTLRDTITHDPSKDEAARVSVETQSTDESRTETEDDEEPKLNSKLASAVETKAIRRKEKEESASETEDSQEGASRVGFGAVVEIPKAYAKKVENKPQKPLKSILKKSSYAEEPRRTKKAHKKKNVSLNLKTEESTTKKSKKKTKETSKKNRPSANWQLNETQFASQVQNGIETVQNPLYDPKLVALRLQLDLMKVRSSKPGAEPAVLDLSGKELTSLPAIICKHDYLSVLNLYMNQIRTLPPEIGLFFIFSCNTC